MTKKQVETKKSTKKVDSKKNETKKVDKKVVKKEEVKKESKLKVILKNIGGKLKAFFNHPAPLIVALIALNLCSLLYFIIKIIKYQLLLYTIILANFGIFKQKEPCGVPQDSFLLPWISQPS